MVFPVVIYGCESWTIKKAECQRIDAFELWCWRRLSRVPWIARRSNQSILKEISPGCSLEGLMLKLKLQYLSTWCKELTHLKRPWCWESLRAVGEWDDRGWDGWMASRTQWTWVWMDSRSWWWTGMPGVLRFMGSRRVGHNWATELNWTQLYSTGNSAPYSVVTYMGRKSKKEGICIGLCIRKEGWAHNNWCFWTVVLEKTLQSPLDCKEIKPVDPKGNQSSIFIGRTDGEAETPILWSPDAKNWLIGKDPDAGKDWRQEVKGTTEDKMVGWNHRPSGREF